jgi:hypothetical protein
MELVLNLGWILTASLMFCVWLRFAPRTPANGRMQFVALAMLILILFPVISVTDDLQTAQYPAIVNSSQRRDHVGSGPHSFFPTVTALPPPVFAGIFLAYRVFPRRPISPPFWWTILPWRPFRSGLRRPPDLLPSFFLHL